MLGQLDPDWWLHVYVAGAGDEAIRLENSSTGRSGTWVHRSNGKNVSHADWNTDGHVIKMVILGQWNTDQDCYLAERAGIEAVRIIYE